MTMQQKTRARRKNDKSSMATAGVFLIKLLSCSSQTPTQVIHSHSSSPFTAMSVGLVRGNRRIAPHSTRATAESDVPSDVHHVMGLWGRSRRATGVDGPHWTRFVYSHLQVWGFRIMVPSFPQSRNRDSSNSAVATARDRVTSVMRDPS